MIPDAAEAAMQAFVDANPDTDRAALGRLIARELRREGWLVAPVGRSQNLPIDRPSNSRPGSKPTEAPPQLPAPIAPTGPRRAADGPTRPREEASMAPTRNPDLTIRPDAAENGQNRPASARTPTRGTASPSRPATASPRAVSGPPALLPAQWALLGMIVEGLTVEQIAKRLGLTAHPVRTRIGRLRRLFNAETTAQLVHRAHLLGLLEPRRSPAAYVRLVGDEVAPVVEWGAGLSSKPRVTADDARLIAARLEASFRGDGS